ncbi:MAG: pyrroline-5-carboxylate reductase family protein [Pseudohongiellaceae bacterium]
MSLLVIGCGKMGGALVSRWAEDTELEITVADPTLTAAPASVKFVQSASELIDQSFDHALIAVKPQMIAEVIPSYLPYINPEACVFSIAAGFSIESLTQIIGQRPIVRMMPNLPAEIGKGVTGYYGNALCSAQHIELARVLTESIGMSVRVETEHDIDKVTAVAGSGPGYAFEIIRCWMKAADSIGLPAETTREIVLATLGGAVDLAGAKTESLEELRNAVTSPNGTTAAGLAELRRNDAFEQLIQSTIDAALARAIELR